MMLPIVPGEVNEVVIKVKYLISLSGEYKFDDPSAVLSFEDSRIVKKFKSRHGLEPSPIIDEDLLDYLEISLYTDRCAYTPSTAKMEKLRNYLMAIAAGFVIAYYLISLTLMLFG